jgi:hypothetical protein
MQRNNIIHLVDDVTLTYLSDEEFQQFWELVGRAVKRKIYAEHGTPLPGQSSLPEESASPG